MFENDKYILNYSEIINLMGKEEHVMNLELENTIIDNPCGVRGTILDNTGDPINEAIVKVFKEDFTPVQHTITLEDGIFVIENFEAGSYLLYAIKDGYRLSTKVTFDAITGITDVGPITLLVDDEANNSILYGTVFKKDDNKPVPGVLLKLYQVEAEVEIIIAHTLTADDGEYFIHNLEAGNYLIDIEDSFFKLAEPINVVIEANTDQRLYIIATQIAKTKEGTINGFIKDNKTGLPIEGATVVLYRIDESTGEELVAITKTDAEGKYFFGYVIEGNYVVKAKVVAHPS